MLLTLFSRFKLLILFASGLSALGAMAGVSMLAMIADVVAQLGEGKDDLKYPFILFVSFVFFVMGFRFFSQFLLIKLSSSVVYDIRKTLLKRIFATTYERIEQIGGNRIMAVMEADVSALSLGLLIIPQFIFNITTVVICLSYMAYISWQLFLVVVVLITIIVIGVRFALGYVHVHQEALREFEDVFFSHLKTLTSAGKEIHLNINRRRHFYSLLMLPLFKKMRQKTILAEIHLAGLDAWVETLVIFVVGALVYGAHTFFPGIGIQAIVGFVLALLYVLDPLSGVIGAAGEINMVRVSLAKIERISLADATDFSLPLYEQIDRQPKISRFNVDQISYCYPAPDIQLDGEGQSNDSVKHCQYSVGPISAEFRSGEITFLVGENGSGKSTFIKMLTGLYPLESGSICMDGKVVGKELSMHCYQSYYTAVFSDAYVFSHLLTPSGELAEDQSVNDVIKLLQLNSKVVSQDGILSSKDLSQGQRKRLALLTSLVEDAQICVYDEVAADQDPLFKQYFYTELLPELRAKGKIIIIISHDDEYFNIADQIIKFEGGRTIT